MDIGHDGSTPVSSDYPLRNNAFTGKIYAVTVDIGENVVAYVEPPENIYARLMAGQ